MNDWITWFNAAGGWWLAGVVRAAWQGGLALLLAFGISRCIQGLSARVKCWIWRLAYVKVLVAFFWAEPVELRLLAAAEGPVEARAVEPALPEARAQPETAMLTRVSPSLSSCLLVFWLAGVAAGGTLIGRDLMRLRTLRRGCTAAEAPSLEECASELSQRLRLARKPRLLMSNRVSAPFVFGMWRPQIVLPSNILSTADSAARRLMLAHELAHVKRGDLFWSWLLTATEALFFFHPVVWLARRESRLVQEMACDSLALWAASARPVEYGQMLLAVIAHGAGDMRPSTAVSVGIFETKHSLERRIKDMKRMRLGRAAVAVSALLLCTGAALIVPWRVVAQKAAEPAAGPAQEVTEAEIELLQKEIELATRHAQAEQEWLERGRSIPQTLLERRREVLLLQQELARRKGDSAAEEKAIREALAEALELWHQQKSRVAAGTLPPKSELGFEREVVRLERELRALSRSIGGRTNSMGPAKVIDGPRQLPTYIDSRVAGVVTKVLVQRGAKVKKGDALIQFDDREARVKLEAALSQVAAAEASLKLNEIEVDSTQAEYRKQKELFERGRAGPPSEAQSPRSAEARLERGRADLRFAQAQADLARLTVESLTLRAPRDGVVSAVRVAPGEYVSAGGRGLIAIED